MGSEQNTKLLNCCGLTGTPLRVPLLGLGGKEGTAAQREYVSFMAKSFFIFFCTSRFVWCDLRPLCLRKIAPSKTGKCTNHPDLHHLKHSHAGTVSGIGT